MERWRSLLRKIRDRLIRFRTWYRERWAILRPAWFAGLITLLVSIAIQVPQARDALVNVAAVNSFAHLILLVTLIIFAFCSFYFPRALFYVQYGITPQNSEDRFEKWRRWTARIIGTVPLVSVALAYLRSNEVLVGFFYLFVSSGFLVFLVYRRTRIFRRYGNSMVKLHDDLPSGTRRGVIVLLAASFILLLVFLLSPVSAPQAIGPIGIIFIAFSSWIAVGSMVLTYPTYRYQLPSLVLIAAAVAALFSLWNDNHQVRSGIVEEKEWRRETFDEHFQGWLKEKRQSGTTASHTESMPVFVVAAEGGGIRAAYWTASILARIQEAYPTFADHLYAISGVSGGSLGGAIFTSLIADQAVRGVDNHGTRSRSVESNILATTRGIVGADFLGPALAGMLYPDFLQRFLPFWGDWVLPDRAKYLEQAWEKAWQESTDSNRFAENFRNLWRPEEIKYSIPSLFMNGTWVEDGTRNVTSNLVPKQPMTRFVKLDDAVARLRKPIRLSTAVHMSSRFTYVSPAGTVNQPKGDLHVVDGGYYENSGALTAAEIVDSITTFCERSENSGICSQLEPVALIISNNPSNPNRLAEGSQDQKKVPRILFQYFSPLWTLLNARTAHGFRAEDYLKAVAGSERTIRFQLKSTGDETVPLGWMLSERTESEINDQVDQLAELGKIGRFLQSE